jgi:hypothetical protein
VHEHHHRGQQQAADGLAMSCPAMSGALPWIASNMRCVADVGAARQAHLIR